LTGAAQRAKVSLTSGTLRHQRHHVPGFDARRKASA
jgi:hypothetical protein